MESLCWMTHDPTGSRRLEIMALFRERHPVASSTGSPTKSPWLFQLICINTLVWSSMTLSVAMASPCFVKPCMVYHGIATGWLIRIQFTKQLHKFHSTSLSSHVQPSIKYHFCGSYPYHFSNFSGSNAYVNPEPQTLLMNWGYPNN